jgi:hypothetical protein
MENSTKFIKMRDQSTDPFLKLYFEILSRFHDYDYEKATAAMNEELRVIIDKCTEHMNAC